MPPSDHRRKIQRAQQVHIDPLPLDLRHRPGDVGFRIEQIHVVAYFQIGKIEPLPRERLIKEPKHPCITPGGPPQKVFRQILCGNQHQNLPQQFQMQPLLAQGEFQLVENIVARVLRRWKILHLPSVRRHQTPHTPNQNPGFPPMRHRHHTESLRQPLISGGITFGNFHAVLITIL